MKRWNWYVIIGWSVAFIISAICWLLFAWLVITAFGGCSKDYSREADGVPPAPPVKCYYFYLVRVPVGFNGEYAYNAQLCDPVDTTRQVQQLNTRWDDSSYWKSLDHSIICNYFIENKTSTLLVR